MSPMNAQNCPLKTGRSQVCPRQAFPKRLGLLPLIISPNSCPPLQNRNSACAQQERSANSRSRKLWLSPLQKAPRGGSAGRAPQDPVGLAGRAEHACALQPAAWRRRGSTAAEAVLGLVLAAPAGWVRCR
eukprot:g22831.t1